MKVALIGGGHIANVHCEAIATLPVARIVGVADTHLARAKTLATRWNATYYTDAHLMIREQRPDVVHVLTPPEHHATIGKLVLEHGCHALIEKPLALTVADAKELFTIAKQHRVQLCADHNFVFAKVFSRAIATARAGAIGDVVSVEASYRYNPRRNPALLEDGAEHCHWAYQLPGGPIQDLLPHPASLALELMGNIETVAHLGHKRGVLPSGRQDEIRILLKCENVIGSISVSLSEKPDVLSLKINGTRGAIQANLYDNSMIVQKDSRLPRAIARGCSGLRTGWQFFKASAANVSDLIACRFDRSAGVQPLIAAFYQSIHEGQQPLLSQERILQVVDLIERLWPPPQRENLQRMRPTGPRLKSRAQACALVTGATGFIGIHLVKKLVAEGLGVRALVRPNSIHAGRLQHLDVEIMEGDLDDRDAVFKATAGITTIYHLGAAMNGNWEDNYNITVKGTEHLVRAALAHGADRLVHVSSLVVYDILNAKQNAIIDENTAYQANPKEMGPYAYSKTEAERMVFDAYKNAGLKVTVVRPGMVIGPYGRVFFPHFGYRLQDKLFVVIGGGDLVLPFTYVENTVDGIYRASFSSNAIGHAYNLVDDGAITVKEYLRQFIQVTGIQARIVSVPYALPYLATKAYEVAAAANLVKAGKTSVDQLRWKHKEVRYDNSKAKKELKWTPSISLDEGLTKTFRWYATQY